jgi:phosphotriesterase-related protein
MPVESAPEEEALTMAMVDTVLGQVDGRTLGSVLSHEHVLISIGNDARHYPWRFDWGRTKANALRELREAKAGGIDTLIDLTTPDLGRDVRYVREMAEGSGLNIVVATGIWRDVPRSFWERDPDEAADIFVREIEVGIEDTGIKAGVIKVANDAEGVTREAEGVLRAAARACKRTGCPISTHQWAPKEVGRRQVEIFREEGTPMDRVCIGHSADSTDPDYLEELLKAGVYLSMDRYPGVPPRPEWQARNRTLKALIDRGWAEKLMVGHDYAPAQS